MQRSKINNLEFSKSSPQRALPPPPGHMEASAGVDVDARDYNELMDEYSLHNLIIRKGKCLDEAPEFISFKRTYL
jgi:hypothetical protein